MNASSSAASKALYKSRYLRIAEAHVSQADVDALGFDVASYKSGDFLLRAGDSLSSAFYVTSGAVEGKHGNDTVYSCAGWCGQNALIDSNAISEVDVLCVADATVLLLKRSAFRSALKFTTRRGPFIGKLVSAKSTARTKKLLGDVCEFKGITFAMANRFELPKMVDYGTHDVDCFTTKGCAPQPEALLDFLKPPMPASDCADLSYVAESSNDDLPHWQNENCLHLSVFAPADVQKPLPVMVWIHGGAFVTGAGSDPPYAGRILASKNAIIVCINYRLGPLGFLSFPELGIPTNLGLQDQICALRWTKKYISHFGGDPSRVTVFGESAGAMSVCSLMGSPIRKREKLFNKAIAMSGAAHCVLSQAHGALTRKLLISRLGLSNVESEEDLLNALKYELPAKKIIAAAELVMGRELVSGGAGAEEMSSLARSLSYLYGKGMPFQPTVYENGPISIDPIFECVPPLVWIARGLAADVTLMTGVMREEYNLFMMDVKQSKFEKIAAAGPAALKAKLSKRLAAYIADDERYHAYDGKCDELAEVFVGGNSSTLSPEQVKLAMERMSSFWLFSLPAEHLLKFHSKHSTAFAYRCDHASDLLGASHALDIPLAFGTLSSPLGTLVRPTDPDTAQVSHEMSNAWVNFAKHGVPHKNARIFKSNSQDVFVYALNEDGSGGYSTGDGLYPGYSPNTSGLVEHKALVRGAL